MSTTDASFGARVSANEATARQILDALAETLDSTEVVIAASEDRDGLWTVSLNFRAAPNETAVRALIGLAAGAQVANALVFETVAAADWVQASLAGLTPVAAGRFLVHGAHDRGRVPPNRIGIEIEAALAFGTGHHGTTRGCLIALDRFAKGQPNRRGSRLKILDLGTGSGVLAIAGARVLRRPVLASDNDASAVRAARANARLNRTGAAVEVIRADGFTSRRFRARGPFDLVLANILLGPLKRMATPMAGRLGSNGRVILSGLLAAHARAALAAYRARGLVLERRIPLDGWVTLVLRGPTHKTQARRAVAACRHGQ
ncbi:MAG TPA: 50S ribosomal protein L11 methyltransferase [Xanthobacteraceae bacterium]|nr:50S ribosomal protein L11 methyltransferase [Xanthobacteraceae bacterium]